MTSSPPAKRLRISSPDQAEPVEERAFDPDSSSKSDHDEHASPSSASSSISSHSPRPEETQTPAPEPISDPRYSAADQQFQLQLKRLTDNLQSEIDEAHEKFTRPRDLGEEMCSEVQSTVNAITRRCSRNSGGFKLDITCEALVRVARLVAAEDTEVVHQMWWALEAMIEGVKEVAEMMRMNGDYRDDLKEALEELSTEYLYHDLIIFEELSEEIEEEAERSEIDIEAYMNG